MKFKVENVYYMPKDLEEGILYISREFSTCAHLCACGCKQKVRTPLGETEWIVHESIDGASLFPSIGNWQLPCRSHYWIRDGKIFWADQWNEAQISYARKREEIKRRDYYERLDNKSSDWIYRVLKAVKLFFIKIFGGRE